MTSLILNRGIGDFLRKRIEVPDRELVLVFCFRKGAASSILGISNHVSEHNNTVYFESHPRRLLTLDASSPQCLTQITGKDYFSGDYIGEIYIGKRKVVDRLGTDSEYSHHVLWVRELEKPYVLPRPFHLVDRQTGAERKFGA